MSFLRQRERIKRLIDHLIPSQLVTAQELAQKLGVSVRTIQRDIRALIAEDVDIKITRGIGGGYVLASTPKSYKVSQAEIQSLLIVEHLASMLNDLNLESDFKKVLSTLATARRYRDPVGYLKDRIFIDTEKWFLADRPESYQNHLDALYNAIMQPCQINITYRKGFRYENRVLEPYGLVGKAGFWYLVAKSKTNFKTYKLERIYGVKLLRESFERQADFNLAQHWETSSIEFEQTDNYNVSFEAHSDCFAVLARIFGETIYHQARETDEWHPLSLTFTNQDYAMRILLGFGLKVRAIAPAELQQAIQAEVQQMAHFYSIEG